MEQEAEPSFDGHIRNYGLWFLRKNHWRIANMCDKDDLPAEAFRIFWEIRRKYPDLTDQKELLKLYRVKLYFHVQMKGQACFPNPYNRSADPQGHCISLTEIEGDGDMLERLSPIALVVNSEIDECLDVLNKMPDELREVCAALFREALGIAKVPALIRRKLHSRPAVESINHALCRLFKLDPKRDLFEEIARAYSKPEGGTMTVESEVLEATKLKRKTKESEQDFLKRIVETIDDWEDDQFKQLSERARAWHDKAALAVNNDEDIPAFDGAKGKAKAMAKNEDDDFDDDDDATEDESLTDDEDEEDEEEEEEEEEVKTKAKGKAKAAKGKAKAAVAAKPKGKGKAKVAKSADSEKRSRGAAVSDDMAIKVLQTESSYREGSKRAKLFDLYKDCANVGEFRKKAVKQGIVDEGREMAFLRLHVKEGLIALE